MTAKAFGRNTADEALGAFNIVYRVPDQHEVQIDITYCGRCDLDLNKICAEWVGTLCPRVLAQEILSMVAAVAAHVRDCQTGDPVVDTVAAPHHVDAYKHLFKRNGILRLGATPAMPRASPGVDAFHFSRKRSILYAEPRPRVVLPTNGQPASPQNSMAASVNHTDPIEKLFFSTYRSTSLSLNHISYNL